MPKEAEELSKRSHRDDPPGQSDINNGTSDEGEDQDNPSISNGADGKSSGAWDTDENPSKSNRKGKEIMIWPGTRATGDHPHGLDHLPGAAPCQCGDLRSHFMRSFGALGFDISGSSAQHRLFRNIIDRISTLEAKKDDLSARPRASGHDSLSSSDESDEDGAFQQLKDSIPYEGPFSLDFDITYYDANSKLSQLYTQALATIAKLSYEIEAIRATRTSKKPLPRQGHRTRSPSPIRSRSRLSSPLSHSRSRSQQRRKDRSPTTVGILRRSSPHRGHSRQRSDANDHEADASDASAHDPKPNDNKEARRRRVQMQHDGEDQRAPDWLLVDRADAGVVYDDFEDAQSYDQVFDARTFNNPNPLAIRKGRFSIKRFLKRHPEVAFVLERRYYCAFEDQRYKARRPKSNWIKILSDKLRRALMQFQVQTQGYIATWDVLMFHSRLAVESALPTFASDVQLEVQFLLDATKEDFDQTSALFDSGMVTGNLLEKLFRPQEVIIDQKEQQKPWEAHLTGSTALAFSASRGHLTLEVSQWSFNGTFLLRASDKIIRCPPDIPIEITSLTSFPLRYAAPEVQDILRKRGETFWLCRRKAFISYSAPNQVQRSQGPGNYRFMIDYSTYRELHPDAEEFLQDTGDDISEEELNSDNPPGNGKELIFPANISGFSIQDKKWKVLLVDHIEPVTWNTRAFERLVLRPTAKELIQAVVQVHLEHHGMSDLMEGKGNGSLILLHGPPGTGKTLTAESVAELVKRPLYRVTCGDVGTDPESVENYLESVLYIAKIWGCVVLMDEADVFLEERTLTDLHRNALVSVFLRVLEYYEGILILTSNRVGTFDEAFKSRIKLALHYTTLGKADRRKIWRNFFKMLKETGSANMDFDDLDDHLDDLADVKLNGRSIRNAISVARELAQFRNNEKLGYHHIKHVIGVGEEFEEYLDTTHGHKTDDWLKENGIRA